MDPAWVSIGIGLVGSLIGAAVSGALCFAALKAWMARREEREQSMGMQVGRLQKVQDDHGVLLSDHAVRIRVLENEIDIRPPPLDYAPRRG